jgi:hypothetical protein
MLVLISGLAVSIGPNRVGILPEGGGRFQSPKCRVLIEIMMMDNVQEEGYFNNTPLSQSFRFKPSSYLQL